jgi:hypothetical protein
MRSFGALLCHACGGSAFYIAVGSSSETFDVNATNDTFSFPVSGKHRKLFVGFVQSNF